MAKHVTLLKNFLRVLLPSFIADLFFPDHKPNWRLHPTSYLDGLRGIASIIVFICHYTEENYSRLIPTYGLSKERPSGWIQLPYLRLIFSGRPMVHIFFIISGFVLSYKPVKAIHVRDFPKSYAALSSSTFRRAFRLYGPCIVSTFFAALLAQRGYRFHDKYDTLSEQLWAWKDAVFHQITWAWGWEHDLRPAYDIHLWTIPIEFAHSMLLFLVIIGTSRVRLRIRQALLVSIMFYCSACGKWAAFEFLAGMFLAELHILQNAHQQNSESCDEIFDLPKKTLRTLKSLKTAIYIIVLAVGLYVAGWPNHDADKTPVISSFLAHTPDPYATSDDSLAAQKFWFGLVAVVVVWIVGDMPFLKRLFETPVAQYSGRVSYAVYIMHGPVMGIYSSRVLGFPGSAAVGEAGTEGFKEAIMGKGVKGYFGVSTPTQLTMGWFVGLCMMGIIVIWAADIFWRAVDEPIVKLARRIEMCCLDDTEEKPRSPGYSAAA